MYKTLFLVLIFGVCSLAYAEEVTITTYYPAPEGVYDELRAEKMGIGPNYYNASIYPLPNDGSISLIAEGKVGIGTTSPNENLEITGNFRLPPTDTSNGVIKLGSDRFIHAFGTQNTFLGVSAGNFSMTGKYNTAVGYSALSANTSGQANVAIGQTTLQTNTTGVSNSAVGQGALLANTTGGGNSAIGVGALGYNLTGSENTAVGMVALLGSNSTGNENVAVGNNTGYSNISGSNNVYLGRAAGWANQTGSGNVFIGYKAGYNETGSNKLYIANSTTNPPLIYGDFSTGKVGIGTSSPQNKLDVEGGAVIGATYSGTNTAPANGLLVEGNVGIGTTNPQNKLDVSGDISINGFKVPKMMTGTVSINTGGNALIDISSMRCSSTPVIMVYWKSSSSLENMYFGNPDGGYIIETVGIIPTKFYIYNWSGPGGRTGWIYSGEFYWAVVSY